MHVITWLKQCSVTSSSFTCGAAYQDLLSRTFSGIMTWFMPGGCSLVCCCHPNDRCWNVYMIFLPIMVAYWVVLIPFSFIIFIVLMPWNACMALSGKRSIEVGKTHLSLCYQHTYQWKYHTWEEGPVEHAHVTAQSFRFEIPPGSVPVQTMSVKVPMDFAQSGQMRVIIIPPLG